MAVMWAHYLFIKNKAKCFYVSKLFLKIKLNVSKMFLIKELFHS